MIIPPDPEKDPRLFTASSSTPSLLPPPSDSDADATESRERDRDRARARGGDVNAAYGYPFGDDLGVGYAGESLPPYERRRSRDSLGLDAPTPTPEMRERGRRGVTAPLPHVIIPTLPHDGADASDGSLTPTQTPVTVAGSSTHLAPTSTAVASSSGAGAKEWEGSASTPSNAKGKGKVTRLLHRSLFRRPASAPAPDTLPAHKGFSSTSSLRSSSTLASQYQSFWAKYKRYIIIASVLLLVGLGLMIGLLVGFKQQQDESYRNPDKQYSAQGPAWHDTDPEDGRRNTVWADGSMNLTWVQARDNPPASDGNMTICNIFTPLNASNFSSLVTPYPGNRLWSSTFLLPLRHFNSSSNSTVDIAATNSLASSSLVAYGLRDELPITSRGIASSGTIEFVGADADDNVINGGIEGMIRVDVVVQYGGFQDKQDIMRVCEMSKDGVMGVGIYTPTMTEGKITNLYMLDPTLLPSFHVVVRFPPSVVWNRATASSATPASGANPSVAPTPDALRMRRVTMTADHMGVRVGDLAGVAMFGTFNFSSARGGVDVAHLAARRVWIGTAENSVRGKFEVSESLYINSTDSSIIADVILVESSNVTSVDEMGLPPAHIPSVYKRGPPGSSAWSGPGASATSRAWREEWASKSTTPAWAAASASPSSPGIASDVVQALTNSSVRITNTVNTTFYTTEGYVSVTYLAHPPSVALTSWVATNQGEMDISFHPNFVGPFAVRNAWGAIRLPRPRPGAGGAWAGDNGNGGTGELVDPMGANRARTVVEGVINVKEGGLFARAGLNGTNLSKSGTTVTGAAYWQQGVNGTMTPVAVQDSWEGRRGRAVVLGGWGDVRVGFVGR